MDWVYWYLRESTGTIGPFREYLENGQRFGQAFFNALSSEDRDKLTGTIYDPFHKDDPFEAYLAIAHVLTA